MTPHDLVAAFETLAEAPDGVKRLRELVLQLASRGRLVPQDAAESLAKVVQVSPLEQNAQPFSIPKSWAWLSLPEVSNYSVGKTPPTKDSSYWGEGEIPWVSIGDMPDGGEISATKRTVTRKAADSIFRRPPVPAGTLLMSFKLTIGKMATLSVAAYHNEAIISITPKPLVARDFLFRILPMMAARGESKDAIMGATLNGQSLAKIWVPVPPLAEQHRIVAKVDELMALLDRLEAARDAREATRAALRAAALDALRTADDAEAVELAWRRIAEGMDHLFAHPDDVKPLRQAVLHLAVRGKLVPQDPNDEPASVLLGRIVVEPTPKMERRGDTSDVAGAFEIPASWCWKAVQSVGSIQLGRQRSPKDHFGLHMVPYLRVANVQDGWLNLSDVKSMNFTPDEQNTFRLRPDDLLLNEGQSRELVGRTSIYQGEVDGACFQNTLLRFRCAGAVFSRFALVVFRTYMHSGRFADAATQTTNIAHLSAGRLATIEFPVPPLAEQHRIVAKVDELMALLDLLEARLQAQHEAHTAFAAAAVHHLEG